jgi:hypothetical protein
LLNKRLAQDLFFKRIRKRNQKTASNKNSAHHSRAPVNAFWKNERSTVTKREMGMYQERLANGNTMEAFWHNMKFAFLNVTRQRRRSATAIGAIGLVLLPDPGQWLY